MANFFSINNNEKYLSRFSSEDDRMHESLKVATLLYCADREDDYTNILKLFGCRRISLPGSGILVCYCSILQSTRLLPATPPEETERVKKPGQVLMISLRQICLFYTTGFCLWKKYQQDFFNM